MRTPIVSMRRFMLAMVLSLMLMLTLAASAAAAYVPVTFNGQTYNYCDHVRAGSPNWTNAGCDAP